MSIENRGFSEHFLALLANRLAIATIVRESENETESSEVTYSDRAHPRLPRRRRRSLDARGRERSTPGPSPSEYRRKNFLGNLGFSLGQLVALLAYFSQTFFSA